MDAFEKEYSRLKDMVVWDIVKDDEGINGEPLYGIVFRGLPSRGWPKNQMRTAWIMMDPEGNGPGFLNIQDSKI